MRKLKEFICIFLIPLMLTGCWDKVELENRGFVITIGIDKDNGKEKQDNKKNDEDKKDNKNIAEKSFSVTLAIANVEAISEKSGEKDKETVKKSKNETLSAAMHTIDSQISQKIYYGHTKLVVMGKDFLEDADMLREAIDALERNNEINQKIIVVATEGEAADILDEAAKDEALVGIYISNFYKNNQKNTASTLKLDLEKLIKNLRLTDCAIIPQVKLEEKEIKLSGAAIIKDFKLVGWLTEDEMKGSLWFKAQAEGAQVLVHDEDIPIPLIVNQNKRTISFSETENKLVCTIKLTVKGAIEEYTLLNQSLFNTKKIEELQAEYEKEIAKELDETFLLFQEKYGIDGFLLKEYLKKWNYPLYLKYEDNWDNAYKEMIFVPEVSVSVSNTGAIK